jgi:hypothetical protein
MFDVTQMTILASTTLFATSVTSSAKSYDRYVELVNNSHLAVTSFYASNVGADSWEEDILGNGILPPGYHVRVNLEDGTSYCRFDLKTRFADGTSIVRRNVDVCAVATYTLTD